MKQKARDFSIKLWGADHKYRIQPQVLYSLAPMDEEHLKACNRSRTNIYPGAYKKTFESGVTGPLMSASLAPGQRFIALTSIFCESARTDRDIDKFTFMAFDEEFKRCEIGFYNLFWFNYHLREWE